MSIPEKNHQYYTIYCIPTFGPPCRNVLGRRSRKHVQPRFETRTSRIEVRSLTFRQRLLIPYGLLFRKTTYSLPNDSRNFIEQKISS